MHDGVADTFDDQNGFQKRRKGNDRPRDGTNVHKHHLLPGDPTSETMQKEGTGYTQCVFRWEHAKPQRIALADRGVGVWWPNRQGKPTAEEATFTRTEKKDEGMMLWAVFNNLTNSSTRSEAAATMAAMLPAWATHIGG